MDKKIALASWSGGKDSCLACYKAMQDGYTIRSLLNFISRESKRCCFHGIEKKLIELQAQCIGLPLAQEETTADMQEYEKEFKQAVSRIRNDAQAMVFGDIYLLEHESWVMRVCKDIGITAVEPLWNRTPQDVFKEFINLGFKAIVVSCQADKFDSSFLGRQLDNDILQELITRKICPCGENGEFHTLVVDGPIFKRSITITRSSPILKEGFWKHWFLDIKEYKTCKKRGA